MSPTAAANEKIVFYSASICPYAQRAAIALKEVGVEYEEKLIDLSNKPDWYKDINSELKVPVLTVEGQNLAESLVIAEYIVDHFPEANLLPKEPIKRANIRFAIEYFSSKAIPAFYKLAFNSTAENARENYETDINAALVRFGELLQQEAATGPYFLGEQFSLADIALAPFIQRIHAIHEEILGGFRPAALSNPRLLEWIRGITARPSVKETYLGDEGFLKFLEEKRGLKKL